MEEKEESTKKKLRPDNPPETAAAAAAAAAAASLLTDDLIVEILSRLPVRSVNRFKCVSMPWRDLIAHPIHRKKLPQTLAGFLYTTYPGGYHHIAGVSATVDVDPSLPFLRPIKYTNIDLVDTCNGLLLCACYYKKETFRFVVCNPATQRWAELPPHPQPRPNESLYTTRLAFDPAVPSHFHVLDFEGTARENYITGVTIYSSRTGAWSHRDTGLAEKIGLFSVSTSVFFGGMLHLLGMLYPNCNNIEDYLVLVAVDMEGKAWKTIRVPYGLHSGTIGWSQGCLHYANKSPAPITVTDDDDENTILLASEIAIWCLEDYDSQEWVLKHSVRIDKLLDITEVEYSVVGIHPDCDTIFFVTKSVYWGDAWQAASLASWDMRCCKFCNVLDLQKGSTGSYLPYVPLFSESLADADGL